MSKATSPLTIVTDSAGDACLLTADGVLDSSTYLQLRDCIVKAALDEPQAVLIDVNKLDVPAPSAWAVFTSARWLVDTWPCIPIRLVCGHSAIRRTIALNGVTRYVRVHATVGEALSALTDTQRPRIRARTELPASLASLRTAREFVAQRLAEWSFDDLVASATVVVNVFVENVLQHTLGGPVLVLETDGKTVTISVQDGSSTPAARHEDPVHGGEQVSGLAIVASMCRAWGSAPTPSGKTVWAVIGPENRL
ncbi:sulfate transporter [Mycobacterium sp. 1245111.1]|uniref:STAS domain-containing protein n=1 Tax=Mycobacterium sp. 1245111.1 TaxID=1834073 RepID=UPI0007FE930A|nr:STAS domain-containing protein [Mycobacterium sp. 1245111.1]OBK40510.1 sulfate transporter [Mycobacterium sp. 1245111.1]